MTNLSMSLLSSKGERQHLPLYELKNKDKK